MTAAEAYKAGQRDMRRRIAEELDWNPYYEQAWKIRPLPKPRRKERKK